MSRSVRGVAARWSVGAAACVMVLFGCGAAPQPPVTAPEPVTQTPAAPESNGGPTYRPSSNSEQLLDISTNAYGAFSAAPDAPEIGDVAADFELPLADGGRFSLAEARKAGPVLVMFYRGFW